MKNLYLKLNTSSEISLKERGVMNYVYHDSFYVTSFAYALSDGIPSYDDYHFFLSGDGKNLPRVLRNFTGKLYCADHFFTLTVLKSLGIEINFEIIDALSLGRRVGFMSLDDVQLPANSRYSAPPCKSLMLLMQGKDRVDFLAFSQKERDIFISHTFSQLEKIIILSQEGRPDSFEREITKITEESNARGIRIDEGLLERGNICIAAYREWLRNGNVPSSSTAYLKFEKIKDFIHNGRIYNAIVYQGQFTGRFSSYGVQLHNFKKSTGETKDSIDIWEVPEYLGRAARSLILPEEGHDLIKIDFKQIEMRIIFWLAKRFDLLEKLKNGEDIYLDFSKKIFGEADAQKNRDIAKTAYIACSYGMGAYEFSRQHKIDMAMAEKIVDAFRKHHPAAKLWYDKSYASRNYSDFKGLHVFTPGGKILNYDLNSINDIPGPTLLSHYCQAIARNILCTMLMRFNFYKQFQLMFTVHDELVYSCEKGKYNEDLIRRIVGQPIIWCEDLPLEVTVNSAETYF